MGEKLKTPPLIEALCEFRFIPGSPWDWVLPGQLYDRIKGEFPIRSQIERMGVEVQSAPRAKPIATIHTGPERVQLKRADGSAMVQVGFNLLAINHLRPYTSWTEFLALIMRIFDDYQGIAGKNELERIGLRYINHLLVPENAEIGDVIALAPPLTGNLVRPIQAFYQRYEIEEDNPEGVLIHQTGTIQDELGKPLFVLDLDFGSTRVQNLIYPQEVREWLNQAHDRVYDAFVSSLNPILYSALIGKT